MTLTNSQIIEVAEKVWGWDAHNLGKHLDSGSPVDYEDQLKEEVNSWAGFGRTVEAKDAED